MRLIWLPLLLFALLAPALAACAAPPLLSEVEVSPGVISPNGDDVDDVATFHYRLGQPAKVAIYLEDAQGGRYPFRNDGLPRPAGGYGATFYGSYAPDTDKDDRRVLPSGQYKVVMVATAGEQTMQGAGTIEVRDADTVPPQLTEVQVLPNPFSPNGDAQDDETVISWKQNKDARIEMSAIDSKGVRYLVEPEKLQTAAFHSVRWNGLTGGQLAAEGNYTLHLHAADKAGNVTDTTAPVTVEGSGTARLEITEARIEPAAVPVNGVLTVSVTLKNSGDTTLRSLGPNPGTPYDTTNNFLQFKDADGQPLYFERPGFWRIGVQWEQAASAYPVRWGWGDRPLRPGEQVTITGTIKVLINQVNRVTFWVNIIREGVGFPNDPVGHKRITISY